MRFISPWQGKTAMRKKTRWLIIIVTIGRKIAEKQEFPAQKNKKIAVWYTIGLVLILLSIPWPFREALNGSWF